MDSDKSIRRNIVDCNQNRSLLQTLLLRHLQLQPFKETAAGGVTF